MNEIWKDIDGYNGAYQVSNLGKVRSVRQDIHPKPYVMKQRIRNDGYVTICLRKENKPKLEYVHTLVAKAFVAGFKEGYEVNHIDGRKSNNVFSNLEWVSRSQNTIHAINHGLRKVCPTIGRTGKDAKNSKPVFQYDIDGNFIKRWDSREEAANFYDCKRGNICNCVNGKKKTYKGFIWKNE